MNEEIEEAFERACEEHVEQAPPADLEEQVRARLEDRPAVSWDQAVAWIAKEDAA